MVCLFLINTKEKLLFIYTIIIYTLSKQWDEARDK